MNDDQYSAFLAVLVPDVDLARLYDVEHRGGADVLYAEVANGL